MGTVVGAQRCRGLGHPHAIQGCRQEGCTWSHPELPLLVKVGIKPGLGILLGDTSKSGLTKGPTCPRHRGSRCRPSSSHAAPGPSSPAGSPAPRCSLLTGPALPTQTGDGTSVYGPGAATVHQLIHFQRYGHRLTAPTGSPSKAQGPRASASVAPRWKTGCVCVCATCVCAGTTAAHLLKGGSECTWPAPVPPVCPRRPISVGSF